MVQQREAADETAEMGEVSDAALRAANAEKQFQSRIDCDKHPRRHGNRRK